MSQPEKFYGTVGDVSSDILERHREAAAELLREDTYELLVGGEWVTPETESVAETVDVTTGETLIGYYEATPETVDRAVEAAQQAYEESWSDFSVEERAERLDELADIFADEKEKLGKIDSLETGRQYRFAPQTIETEVVDKLRYYAETIRSGSTARTPVSTANRLVQEVSEPYGVVGAIASYNGQVGFLGTKVVPALAAGNTVIYKPAPRATTAALETAKLFDRVLPAGTVNILTGGAEVGGALASHRDVRKISLTGSVAAGRAVMESAASSITDVHLELGGKSSYIVFPDADLEEAGRNAMTAIFSRAGQLCTAGSRLFLHEEIYDEFLRALKRATASYFRPGDPLDPETTYSPLVDHEHRERVHSFVETALDEGAELYMGGEELEVPELGATPFYSPTILTNVSNDDTIACEEVFGPVLTVIKWREYDEMIRQANDTELALAAGVWSTDVEKAYATARELNVGTVWVNDYNDVRTDTSFGGFKQSGIGRERGKEGLEEFCQTKVMNISLG